MAYRDQRRRAWVAEACGWTLEIVKPPPRRGLSAGDGEPTPRPPFTVLPRRGMVERPIAWIGRSRRLRNEDASLPESSATLMSLAMSRLRRRRLVRQAPYGVPSPQRHGLNGLARAF
jgi:transposase